MQECISVISSLPLYPLPYEVRLIKRQFVSRTWILMRHYSVAGEVGTERILHHDLNMRGFMGLRIRPL
jgi:hypothetical protein